MERALHRFIDLPVAYAHLRPLLERRADELIRQSLGPSGSRGHEAVSDIAVGRPAAGRDELVFIPLRWNGGGPVPVFDGVLGVSLMTRETSRLTLRGRYEPPPGAVRTLVDGLERHRDAERYADRLLEDLADAIYALATAPV